MAYQYEPIWLNTETAKARGIQACDIVKIFNERGNSVGGAYVTERLVPNVAYMDHGSRLDLFVREKSTGTVAINTITPNSIISKNATGIGHKRFPG
jgi:trimethylamine-N-oxide reductase (cytochrome c)